MVSLVQPFAKITAAAYNALAKVVNQQGLVGVIPTSVAGSGSAVTANGRVTFTAAQGISLNGVFTGGFDNYRVTWNSTTRSGTSSVAIRLRAAGTDISTNYDYVRGVDSGTARAVTSNSASSGPPLDTGIAAGQICNGVLDLFGPALTTSTTGTSQATVIASSAAYFVQTGFAQESGTSYDGLTLFVATGQTWSGTIRVYGYNNLT